jgi:hypothetical protein
MLKLSQKQQKLGAKLRQNAIHILPMLKLRDCENLNQIEPKMSKLAQKIK